MMTMVDQATQRILARGPAYLRDRMMQRQSGILQRRRTKSCADELAESKSLYLVTSLSHEENLSSFTLPANNHQAEKTTDDEAMQSEQSSGHRTSPNKDSQSLTSPEPLLHPMTPHMHSVTSPDKHLHSVTPPNEPASDEDREVEAINEGRLLSEDFSVGQQQQQQSTLLVADTTTTAAVTATTTAAVTATTTTTIPPPVPPRRKPPIAPKPTVKIMSTTPGTRTPPYKHKPKRQDSLPIAMHRQDSGSGLDVHHRLCSMDSMDGLHHHPHYSHRMADTPGGSSEGTSDHGFQIARQPSFTRSRPKIPTIATLEYQELGGGPDSGGSDCEKKSNGSSTTKHHNGTSGPVVRRRHRKVISRSRSDLTKRLSNSSDLSELSFRLSRNSADLERFFNEMGLDQDILQPMLSSQYAAAAQWPSLYESVSCIASPDNNSICSGRSVSGVGGAGAECSEPPRSLDTMSVVERNARIIKWLGGVKKAAGSASD